MQRLAATRFALLLASLLAVPGASGEDGPSLRVGTSGDYAPFSLLRSDPPRVLEGFDVAVARAYAEDRALALEFVGFRWPALLRDLAEEKFDVAMSGVTIRPERSAAGRFTVPVAESGAMALVHQPERWPALDALDRLGARIGVNAGGHLERVAAARFPRATLVVIPDNFSVRRALLERNVDAVVTDGLEARSWMRGAEHLAALGPFTRDRKAYLVRADLPGLAADLDSWLLERERDGSLARLRRDHLGETAGGPVATPLGALFAAVDERLAMMPLIGVAKRRTGVPLEVPEREEVVLDAAVAGARDAARRSGLPSPPDLVVRAVFRAQMEAAKQVQWDAVRDPEYSPPEPLPELNRVLRPALLRIGERVARLLVALPPGLDRASVRAAAREALRAPRLSERSVLRIADAVTALSRAPRGERPGSVSRRPTASDAGGAP